VPGKALNMPTIQKAAPVARTPAQKPFSQARSIDPVLLQCVMADPALLELAGMLSLQRVAGNHAVVLRG